MAKVRKKVRKLTAKGRAAISQAQKARWRKWRAKKRARAMKRKTA